MTTKNYVRLGLLLGTVLSANAFGQACSATGGGLAGPSSAPFDLCTFTDQLAQDCGNSTNIGNAKDAIFSFTLGAGNNTTITVTPTGYQAYVGLMSGASCNSTDTCGATENESASVGAAVATSTNGLAAGSYFLIVSNIENTTCGAFTLAVSGPLPVKLQNFSIE